jgi:four helix bundle protein
METRHAASFRELVVHQKAMALARDVFVTSKRFPREEMYSLTDQIRRSSRSIGAQIAEAWGKRRYESHFISKLTDADGEQYETQHWVDVALDCEYVFPDEASCLLGALTEIGRMLGGMIAKAPSFCQSATGLVRDPLTDYFAHAVVDH